MIGINKNSIARVIALILSVSSCLCIAGMAHAVPISGRVLGPDGKAVAGAEVIVVLQNGRDFITAKTDEAGKYTVELDPAAGMNGYLARAIVVAPDMALGSSSAWTGKETSKDAYDIQLQPPATISGIVRDKEGQPVAGTGVKLLRLTWLLQTGKQNRYGFNVPEPLVAKFTTKTDDDGKWTLPGVATKGTAHVYLDDARFVRSYIPVELGSNSPVTIEARRGGVIEGKVVFEDGRPAANVKISARGRMGEGTGNKIVTDNDGIFRAPGLASGNYNLIATEPTGEWVATTVAGIQATEGETVQAPSMVLTAGAIIEGKVTDADTGAPIAKVRIASHDPQAPYSVGTNTATSDEKGNYKLRVVPGKNLLNIGGMPAGYLQQPVSKTQEIAKGETKTVDFTLRMGAKAVLVVVDEASKPVADVTVTLTKQQNFAGDQETWWSNPQSHKTDAMGKWQAEGLAPGTWNISVGDGWEIVTPISLSVPVQGATRIKLRKRTLASVRGRVVDGSGRPIAGAIIKARVSPPQPKNNEMVYYGGSQQNRADITTDEAGGFVVPDIHPGHDVVLQVNKPGHIYLSGGKVLWKAGGYSSTDTVLAPLTARVEGIVTDAAKTPVSGARVFSPNGGPDALATTDETGKFVLAALPEGDVTLIAVRGHDAAASRVKTGEAVSLSLKPRTTLPGRDVWRAEELLWRAKAEAATGNSNPEFAGDMSYQFAYLILRHSPDAALRLSADFYGNLNDDMVAMLIGRLCEIAPARAALWAPAKLGGLKGSPQSLHALIAVATAVADSDPEMARELYNQARRYIESRPAALQQMGPITSNVRLWKLAAALNLPIEEHRRIVVEGLEAHQDNNNFWGLIELLADVDMALAEKTLQRVPEAQRLQHYQQVVAHVARRDIPAALRLLEQIEKSSHEHATSYFATASLKVIRVMGKTDPAGALALARRARENNSRTAALIQAAAFQPKDTAIAVLREAYGIAPEYSGHHPARIAALIYELDPEAGLKLFESSRPKMEQQSGPYRNTATWAFYYSRIDPAESRILLEQEFAREKDKTLQAGDAQPLLPLVGAMVAVDVNRALEMWAAIPASSNRNDYWNRMNTLQTIARYLLSPASKRATMSFNGQNYGFNDEDE